MTKTTTGVAAAGFTLHAWYPTLQAWSIEAAALVPLLSALWLILQIVRLLVRWRKGDVA